MPTEYRVRLRSKLARELCLNAIASDGVYSQGPILKAIKRSNGCWTVSNLSISSVFSDYCHTLPLPRMRFRRTRSVYMQIKYYILIVSRAYAAQKTPHLRVVLLLPFTINIIIIIIILPCVHVP